MFICPSRAMQVAQVGFYSPDGEWHPESTHPTNKDAAQRVHWLNGHGVSHKEHAKALGSLKEESIPAEVGLNHCHRNFIRAMARKPTKRNTRRMHLWRKRMNYHLNGFLKPHVHRTFTRYA